MDRRYTVCTIHKEPQTLDSHCEEEGKNEPTHKIKKEAEKEIYFHHRLLVIWTFRHMLMNKKPKENPFFF